MPGQTMYFGTKERMAWVKCPAINADISKVGWSASATYINGGAFVRKSSTGHKEIGFSWNLAKQAELDTILDYADGLYGDGPFYFLDPFATTNNLFPQYWAAPRLAAEDAPLLIKGQTPSLTATPGNTINLPTMSASYTCHYGDTYASMYFPIPSGYALNLGIFGNTTGTAQAVVIPDGTAAPSVTTRTQLVKNPDSATTPFGISGYGTSGVGTNVRTAGAGEGGSYGVVTTWTTASTTGAVGIRMGGLSTADDISVVAGTTVNADIIMKSTQAISNTVQTEIAFFTNAGVAVGSSVLSAGTTFTAGQEKRLPTVSVVVPATATRAMVSARLSSMAGTTNGVVVTLSKPYVSTVAGTYFNGSTVDSNPSSTTALHYAWTGTVNASTSTETTTVVPGQVALTLLANNSIVRTNYALSGVTGATVTFRGYSGSLTLAGMIAQVRPIGQAVPIGNFISGKGNSGVRFKELPKVQGYSAPEALDLVGASATLVETGAWED